MRLSALAACSCLLLAACAPGGEGAPAGVESASAVHPVSGLEVIPLTVTHGERVHAFRVEVARSPQEQARGLMFRAAMGADEGMIFPMDPPRGAAFWMKNTVIPLDIIYIGPDRRITNIAANTVPYSLESLPSVGPVIGVLELNGGRAAELGITAGDRVDW